jgi:sigma-B regulation protein RsbU (phosphoserine phosphatase)
VEDIDLEEVDAELHPGDLICLYTDGITDANSTAGELYGLERLREAICATDGLSASDACDFILDSVDRFQAGTLQYDDMALLVVKLS